MIAVRSVCWFAMTRFDRRRQFLLLDLDRPAGLHHRGGVQHRLGDLEPHRGRRRSFAPVSDAERQRGRGACGDLVLVGADMGQSGGPEGQHACDRDRPLRQRFG